MNRPITNTPRCEPLEQRTLLSGNVSLSAGEVLQLRGDSAANAVRITRTDSENMLAEGLDGTKINGKNQVRFSSSGIEKVDIKLFGRADRLIIRGLRASNDINIETDGGNDKVNLKNVRAGVVMSVKTDDGKDTVTATNVRTGSDFKIETGEGRSEVLVRDSTIDNTLTVIGLDRADLITVRRTSTGEDFNLEAGEGDDVVTLSDILSEKNIKVDMQTGQDLVKVTDVHAEHDAVFLGGDGFDTFDDNGVSGGEKLEIKEFNRMI